MAAVVVAAGASIVGNHVLEDRPAAFIGSRRSASVRRRMSVRCSSSSSSSPSSKSKKAAGHPRGDDSGKIRKETGPPPPIALHLELKHPETKQEALQLNMVELSYGGHGLLYGSRIPKHFFNVRGFGQTDEGDGSDPWETGSFDLALEDAGIHDLNITKYTSVIPPEASKVSSSEAKAFFRHGAVMEAIMSTMHGVKGDRITAGVGRVHIRRKSDGFHIGGYAAEYEGHATVQKAEKILRADLDGIVNRRFRSDEYECFDEEFTIESAEVDKAFGTVLAAICFTTYVFPVYVPHDSS